MSTLLAIADLTADLPVDGEQRSVLRGVSLEVGAGEAVGLVGESGAGKSMVARSITRLLPPGAVRGGSVSFAGEEVHDLHGEALQGFRRGGVALVPQDPLAAINPVHTIGDFLTEPLRVSGVGPKEARARAAASLAEVGIDAPERILRQHPHELSGGMLQRVMICSALLSESRLIVADEPTTALDATTQSEVMAILGELRERRGLGLLFISHDLELATSTCDRIAVMYAGEIVEVQSARGIEVRPRHPYTKGLFAASPRIDAASRTRLAAIPGRSLSAYEVGPGCAYANRCPWAVEKCMAVHPDLIVDSSAAYRCFRPEAVAATVDGLSTEGSPAGPDPHPRAELPVLTVESLRKVFRGSGGRPDHVAVADISFALREGGSIAVVGESGSGKTTLARMIAGIVTPTSGEIDFGDGAVAAPRRLRDRRRHARQVQMVFQNPFSSLDPRQSGRDCLEEALRVHTDLPRDERAARITRLGDQVGLGGREMSVRPRDLSGGQRQRLAIARALAMDPRILVLDEAVAALDVSVQAQILNLLGEIRAETGIAYLFISHDLAVTRQVTDFVIVMREGQVVEQGPTEEVLDRPRDPYTRLLRECVPAVGWRPRRLAPAALAPE